MEGIEDLFLNKNYVIKEVIYEDKECKINLEIMELQSATKIIIISQIYLLICLRGNSWIVE